MSNSNAKKVYVALDTLLDTRLGAMLLISEDFAFEVTAQKTYYTRTQDQFSSVSMGQLPAATLRSVMLANPLPVLQRSLVTQIPTFLLELLLRFKMMAQTTPYLTDIAVEINTFPYVLSDKEQVDLIDSVHQRIHGQCPITVICLDVAALTPEHVTEHYAAVIMYYYAEWLDIHAQAIRKTPLKNVVLYVPQLYYGQAPTEEQLQEFARHGTTLFEFSRTLLDPLVNIQYVPVNLFCAYTPLNAG